jgi:ubiquitin-protein ligase
MDTKTHILNSFKNKLSEKDQCQEQNKEEKKSYFVSGRNKNQNQNQNEAYIKLHIYSKIYPELFFEIETVSPFFSWNISESNKDNNHKILFKLLKEYNLLDIPSSTKNNKVHVQIDKHIKNLIEFIEIIKIYNYCFHCGNMLDLISTDNKFISCNKEECINICNSLLLDDTISQEFQKYKNTPNISVLEFIVKTSYWAINSIRSEIIYKPYPLHIENLAKVQEKDSWKILVIDFINKFPIKHILEILKNHDSDVDLFNEIGEIGYSFIKFTIKSNNTMIYHGNLISSSDVYDIIGKNIEPNEELENYINYLGNNIENLTQFSVVHSQQVENKFKKAKQTCYLYHGSKQENWYSIMRNGLKVGSADNKLLINGAVHGTGIYLSDAIDFSLTYSNSDNIIIGVYQVMENRDKWKKTNNIYVVPDETNVILKYLLVLNDIENNKSKNNTSNMSYSRYRSNGNFNFNSDMMKILDYKFNSSIHKENATKQTQVSSLRNKRLMKEYKTLLEQDSKKRGFSLKLSKEDSLDLWNISIQSDGFEGNPKLQKDMEKYGIKEVLLEFRFNENYPVQPPFVRIISPRFIYRTGHITLGGSICMELLTNQGWDITTSVSTVITYVKSAILEGEGEIDPKSKNNYSLDEAQDAFNRMLKSHGWI